MLTVALILQSFEPISINLSPALNLHELLKQGQVCLELGVPDSEPLF